MTEGATRALRLRWMPGRYGVYRFAPDEAPPPWAREGDFTTVSRSPRELSVLAAWRDPDPGVPSIGPLACCAVEGVLDFALTGVIARLTAPLAAGGVSVFSVATYDTDYLLVGAAQAHTARTLLAEAGIAFAHGSGSSQG